MKREREMSIIHQLPDFLGFNLPDATGDVELAIYRPFSDAEVRKQAIINILPIIAVGAGAGAVLGAAAGFGVGAGIGAAVGASVSVASLVIPVAAGTIIGGVVGGGATALIKYPAETQKILEQARVITEGMERYKELIQLTLEMLGEREIDQEERATKMQITCPITLLPMIFPVNLGCTKEVSHPVESAALFEHISSGKTLCPTCQRPIDKERFTFDRSTSSTVLKVAGRIFQQLERVVNRIPNNFHSKMRNFEEKELMEWMKSVVESGEPILGDSAQNLRDSAQNLLTKLDNPETLTDEEAYAISFYLVQGFKPILRTVRTTKRVGMMVLDKMAESGKMNKQECSNKKQELRIWAQELEKKMIPSECKIIRKIVSHGDF